LLRAGDSGVQSTVRVRVSLLANVAAHLVDPRDRWHGHVRERLRGDDLTALRVLAARRSELPGLVVPATGGASLTVEEELAALGDAHVRAALEAVWRRAYAPLASAMTRLLERERLAAGATLAKERPRAALARAQPGLQAEGTVVLMPLLAGPGALHVDASHPDGTLIAYAAPGAEQLWEHAAPHDGLAALLGGTRARVAASVHAPRTTGEVARLVGVSPSLASQHLSALRDRGMVDRHRRGRHAFHQLTPLGRRVCDAMRS
jgi:DNA-binding transcriptional ArsR family regulator